MTKRTGMRLMAYANNEQGMSGYKRVRAE